MTQIKVFQYIEKYDAFEVTPEYYEATGYLGLHEWTPVVWITRLLTMDNDFGEHVFDNWDEREALEDRHGEKDLSHLLIVVGNRFQDGRDGPCNSDEFRKKFWTDVLKSMHLSLDTIFDKARQYNDSWKDCEFYPEKYKNDIEERIATIQRRYDAGTLGNKSIDQQRKKNKKNSQ